MPEKFLTKSEATKYLNIDKKTFENYVNFSGEIKKFNSRKFEQAELDRWKNEKKNRTVFLTINEYTKCFVLAIQMSYSKKSSAGTGIRGARSEMQQSDDWILGILAEFGLKKFLKKKFRTSIKIDIEPHPDKGITEQDIVEVNGRPPKMKVAVKSSKEKSCFIVVPPIEYENRKRLSHVYIFARVMLPTDHLFRVLRSHSFFNVARGLLDKRVRKQEAKIVQIQRSLKKVEKQIMALDNKRKKIKKIKNKRKREKERKKICKEKKSKKEIIKKLEKEITKLQVYKKIEPLPQKIPVWVCGFTKRRNLEKRTEIPGQKFSGTKDSKTGKEKNKHRYVKSVAKLKNDDTSWKSLVRKL